MFFPPKYILPICLFGCFGHALADSVAVPQADSRSVKNADFFIRSANSDKFTETWSYQFVFDDGTRAYINYATLVIPASGKKIGCDLSFQKFQGKNVNVGRQYPPERLTEDRAKNRISIKGEYVMEGFPGKGHRVLFTADKNGKFLVDVTFASATAGKVPGNGIWKIDGTEYGEAILIPYGRVEGKIAYNEDTVAVKGYGYFEHTWQSGNANDIAKRAFNLSEATKAAYAGRIALSPEGTPFGYVVHKTDSGSGTLLPKAILVNGKVYKGDEFPGSAMKIVWQNSNDTLSIDMSKPRQKASMLDNFDGWFAKKAAKLVLGGDLYFWRGRSKNADGLVFDWTITGP